MWGWIFVMLNHWGHMIKDNNPKLSSKCMKIIECDTARISKVGNKLFLIIGFNKNTKDDSVGQCFINGEPVDYDYVAEKVIASGKTENELIKSTKEYSGLCEMTIFEYLTEKANENRL